MPAITRVGDKSTGHGGFPPTTALPGGASTTVLINGLGVVIDGSQWAPHTNGNSAHPEASAPSGRNVLIEGKAVVCIGDPLTGGDTSAAGSTNVFAN